MSATYNRKRNDPARARARGRRSGSEELICKTLAIRWKLRRIFVVKTSSLENCRIARERVCITCTFTAGAPDGNLGRHGFRGFFATVEGFMTCLQV